MARGRLVSRTLGSSRRFAALRDRAGKLGEFAQSLYPLLIANSDDFGRMAGDAFTVKHAVFPSSPRKEDEFAAVLKVMHIVRLIHLYEVDGSQLLQIEDFDSHQPGLHKRTAEKFPAPPVNAREIPSELKRTELKGIEGKGTEEKVTEEEKAAADAALLTDGTETLEGKVRTLVQAHHYVNPEDHRPSPGLVELLVAEQAAHLPKGLDDPDLADSVKQRCAVLRLTYDSSLVGGAIESERAKHDKGVPRRRRPSSWTSVGDLAAARRKGA